MGETAHTLSRRGFLTGAAASAAILGLTACGANQGSASAVGGGAVPSKWDMEADVVVVGAGGAGFMAACAACEQGSSALLLEKMSIVGGDTAVSGQTIQGIWPDKVKELYGVDDSIEAFMEDWKKSHFGTEKGKRGEPLPDEFPFSQRELELLPEVYEWLEEAGVVWSATGEESPTYIYPQPIWDTTFPRSWTANDTKVMGPLQNKADALGVKVVTETQATQLIVDESGRIVGLYARDKKEKRLAIKAQKAVILTSGSFCGNKALMAQYLPSPQALVYSSGCFGNTGDGLMMAWEVGAALKEMTLGSHWIVQESLSDSMVWFGYMSQFEGPEGKMKVGDTPHVLINYDGKRFMSETEGYKWTGQGVAEQKYHEAYMVFDSANQAAVDIALASVPNQQLMCKADTLEDLARQMQVPVEDMVAEIAKYNGYVDAGSDPDFKRHMENVTRVETAPFYAIRLRPKPYTTYGGIDVDLDAHVLDTKGEQIKGLYAAGTCTYCFCESEGLYYIGGVAQSTTYGRLAGKNAAAEKPWS